MLILAGGNTGTVLKEKKVADMIVGELEEIIRKTISEFLDPDHRLELRPEIEKELEDSLKQKERAEGTPLEKVIKTQFIHM